MRNLRPMVFAGWVLLILSSILLPGSSALAEASILKQDCTVSATNLCLNQERFQVEVEWRDFKDNVGMAQVVPFGSDDSGLFWFFGADNWEMLVKVLDGCANNGHFWVFSAATTNVEYTLRVRDTDTGAIKSYTNPLGNAADALADTQAIACSAAEQLRAQEEVLSSGTPLVSRSLKSYEKQQSCVPGETDLCLNLARFRVEVDWRDFSDNTGSAQVVPVGSDDSGLFWFFGANNWEMLVKVLDGDNVNGHFWVFSAATTTVEYTLRVTDTVTGEVMEYFNPLGNAAAAITDTEAFVWSNYPPMASDVSATTEMNQAVDIPIVGDVASDPDDGPEQLRVSGVTQPTKGGTASIVAGAQSVSFNPDLGFVTDGQAVTFTYTVFDGEDSATANVEVEVTPLPDPTCSKLAAAPATINSGESSTLSWSQTNGVLATLNGDPVPLDGPHTVSPASTQTYTLEITGQPGTTLATCGPITVTVLRPPAEGKYTGTTSQDRSFSVTVTDGKVKTFSISYNCVFFTALTTVTFSNGCTINNDGSFSCGSFPFCPLFLTGFRIRGTFSGETVSGTASIADQPSFSSSCCDLSPSFSATFSGSPAAARTAAADAMIFEGDNEMRLTSEACWDPSSLEGRPQGDACVQESHTLFVGD